MLNDVLYHFGLDPAEFECDPFGPGLINHTYYVHGKGENYILQQINNSVFTSPWLIANNLELLKQYFQQHFPEYLFVAPLPTKTSDYLYDAHGSYFRLFPFIKNSVTIDVINSEKEAYEAALQFGRFTRLLTNFNTQQLAYTLADFHNLNLRFNQFNEAVKNAKPERLDIARNEIAAVYSNENIQHTYQNIVTLNELPLRVIHHDTKISNVLFDKQQNGLCVIDLDTVMPGYFLSDVGDMMRTYLSPANEEEKDLDKIIIRTDYFVAIYKGYISEMGDILTGKEKGYFIFSGKLMIYMQAIRFLTDYLNNDIYYQPKYNGHNLVRAKNQLSLLNKYIAAESTFKQLMAVADTELQAKTSKPTKAY
jgi:Ser/Thr protein kinase RdoA (MazF antagonist)